MIKDNQEDKYRNELRVDCKNCFGLCCVALYFSTSDGFPTDKEAGKPCINLQEDFTCFVHTSLREKGLKGCTSYDCFGAGQKVAQVTFGGQNWQKDKKQAETMFDVFLRMRQFHEMLWYLTQAYELQPDSKIKEEIGMIREDTRNKTLLAPEPFLALDVDTHLNHVNRLLKNTSEIIRAKVNKNNTSGNKVGNKNKLPRKDYFGADLRKSNLKGVDLRGACLIAANLQGVDLSCTDLLGADLRDANLCGSNLSQAIFLTQAQINTTKGDSKTKLPQEIVRPAYWIM